MNRRHYSKEFLKVIEDNTGLIYKISDAYCKRKEDQEDLIQEIIIQVWQSFPRFNSQVKISTWIYRIALNVSISFYRKRYKRNSVFEELKEDQPTEAYQLDAVADENINQLRYFISQLDEFNKALMLLYLDQYSYEDIASTLGITKTNVATKISRIKQQLKTMFNNKNN